MFRPWTLFLFLALFVHTASARSITFYVATNGNDGWSGRLDKPARNGQDGPFATVPAALKAARLARQSSKQTFERITIFLRGGTYSITAPVVLGPEDSGTSADQ